MEYLYIKAQSTVVDYFCFVEEFYNTSKACLKNCQDCAVTINKLIKRCKNVELVNLKGTPLERFDDLQYILSASLHNKVSYCILEIKSELCKVEDLFEKLTHKNQKLLDICSSFDPRQTTPFITGTPLQPSLKQLLEFAEDTLTFGGEVCAQIDNALVTFTYKGLYTENFAEHFEIPSRWRQRIPEIISLTSFCAENQIE